DTGAVPGDAVWAAGTVTFGTYKRGLFLQPGAAHVGRLELVDIGLALPPPDLCALEAADAGRLFPRPGPYDSKYTRGVVGVVAGSDAYTGAAVLATGGALRGGAGFVRFVSVEHPAEQVRLAHPEAVVTVVGPGDGEGVLAAGRVQAWVVGPGVGTGEDSERVVAAVLGSDVPVLVDADALTVVSRRPGLLRRAAPTLLTPHEGEFARLTRVDAGALAADRLGVVRRAAAELGVTVLLKGSRTLVVDPDGTARVNTSGCDWLATAGSGDVLSGLAGALLAAGLPPLDAGSVAAYLHGLAAERATPPLVAGDLLTSLPSAVTAVREPGQ
ncbi:MAG TPA: NAD(P)H-hydrate dehydratase, partial [Frankiaceae bacterium]|nr:NAD(P)H-hydrate dehydratase [Frankiaceae bacterium]